MTPFERHLNDLVLQAQIATAAAGVITIAFMSWLSFVVLRAAIREGMLQYDERRRKQPTQRATSSPPSDAPTGFKWVLVPDDALPHAATPIDMRAD